MTIPSLLGLQFNQGRFFGHLTEYKFGFNAEVGTDEETLWDEGGLYSHPSSASVMKVSSSNAADTSTTVMVSGLDVNYDEVSETVTLNGQTAVNTSNEYLRVFRAKVTSNEPQGNVYVGTGTVSSGVPANKFAKILIGENQTLMAVWSVPAGYTAHLHEVSASSGTTAANKFTTVRLKVTPFGEVPQTKVVQTLHNSFIELDFGVPIQIPEKSDVELRAVSSSGSDAVSGTMTFVYVKNG
jgi:hypothetical protein